MTEVQKLMLMDDALSLCGLDDKLKNAYLRTTDRTNTPTFDERSSNHQGIRFRAKFVRREIELTIALGMV